MTYLDLISELNALRGGLSAAYNIAPSESDIESILDNLERQVGDLIKAVKDDCCCSTHFVTGGVCGGEPEFDSEHF